MARKDIHRPPITAHHERGRIVVTGDNTGIVVTAQTRRFRRNPVAQMVAEAKQQIAKKDLFEQTETTGEAGLAFLYLAKDTARRARRSIRITIASTTLLASGGLLTLPLLTNPVGLGVSTGLIVASGVNVLRGWRRANAVAVRAEELVDVANEFSEKRHKELQRREPRNVRYN